MLLNILMNIWFFGGIAGVAYVIFQMYRGVFISWREMGFLLFGLGLGGIPFFWVMQQYI